MVNFTGNVICSYLGCNLFILFSKLKIKNTIYEGRRKLSLG